MAIETKKARWLLIILLTAILLLVIDWIIKCLFH